jgi:transcriptional regulator with XRE-family HTH domain
MGDTSSIALPQSQAMLHCEPKVTIYDIEMTLGKRIKAARERLDPRMTQPQVAAVFHITVQAVSGWERDESIPELDKIAKLARILKVPASWLLEGKGAPPASGALESILEQLDPSARELLEAMAQTLLKQRDAAA